MSLEQIAVDVACETIGETLRSNAKLREEWEGRIACCIGGDKLAANRVLKELFNVEVKDETVS